MSKNNKPKEREDLIINKLAKSVKTIVLLKKRIEDLEEKIRDITNSKEFDPYVV